jgi:ribonuclease HII
MAADAPNLFSPSLPEQSLETKSIERLFWEEGFAFVAGVDEAGRGALAGPVVAGAVILDDDFDAAGLNDSKKLDPRTREELFEAVTAGARAWAVGVTSARYIEKFNILNAALEAMARACARLAPAPEVLLVDGNRRVPTTLRQRTIVGGDGLCASIAAASIVAKVYRDRLMTLLDAKYPGYGFAAHKGYGTDNHLRAIANFGPSPAHRRSFKPFGAAFGHQTAELWEADG